ncbi:MAG: LEPR-XLL domain-containing protein, partial [Planctomycetota bacterium]|nr:LEPR-XLL domain-containing protein [Planctomycetota bacterium]
MFTRPARKATRSTRPEDSIWEEAASAWLMETLEPRVLLSAAPVATHDFLLFHQAGSARPSASAAAVGLSPATIRQAYGINSVSFGGIVGDGTGQTIAIVDAYDAPTIAADLHAFDLRFGLADPPSFTKIGQTGTSTL